MPYPAIRIDGNTVPGKPVFIIDINGNPVSIGGGGGGGATVGNAATSTPTTVAATTTGAPGNILPADPTRLGFAIRNPSTSATMYILFGPGAATLTNWRYALAPSGRLDNEGWQGAVSAVWSAADGSSALVWSDTP